MAIQHLTEEQIQTMTVQEKDRWWLENVYQGDVRQMTLRVVVCGFVLGGLLSITNLYIGAKTGWSLGVGITSVVLAFVISLQTCLAMFLGALIIWLLGRTFPRPEQGVNRIIVQNCESVCAGTVAGAALIGVGVMVIELFLL